jgi:hypothetical protein
LSPLPVQNLPKVQEVGEEPPAAEEQLSPHATLAPKIPENAEGWGSVLAIHENSAKFELGRSLHIVHIGWMVNGTCVIGNHSNCDALIPESQLNDKQEFLPMDYFALRVRGRRGALTVLEADEVYINGNSPEKEDYDDFTDLNFEIIRRDDQLNEDFTVSLHLTEDRTLPDPRARLLQIDCEDPLAASLFTHGLPTRTPRTLSYGPIEITMLFDGDSVTLSDYLTGYKSETGFHPFFIQQNDARFKTAPEDGIAVTLNAGDKFMVGASIYQVKKG